MMFLELRQGKHKLVVNAEYIISILPKVKGRGSILMMNYDDLSYDVDDTVGEIVRAMSILDLVRKPVNEDAVG